MKHFINNRLNSMRVLSSLFLMIGIIMSFKLWVGDRTFPLCPVSDSIPQFSGGADVFVTVLLLVLLALGIVFKYRLIFVSIIILLLLLFLQDQMRWQPWVYLYVLILVPFSINIKRTHLVTYFQILIIAVYLWGGLHKLSPDFIDNTYNMILRDMFGITNQETILSLRPFGYIIPVFETIIGVLLFVPKTRLLGILGAIFTHGFITVLLMSINSNTTLYPWNIAMVLFVIVLFYKNDNPLNFWGSLDWKLRGLNLKAILLVVLIPGLALFNKWDHYLSFGLYSGKTNLFYICIDNENVNEVDKNLHQFFWNPEGLTRGKMISLNHWAADELNVPFYPETRVFKIVAESFCKSGNSDIYIFAEFDRAFKPGEVETFVCADL